MTSWGVWLSEELCPWPMRKLLERSWFFIWRRSLATVDCLASRERRCSYPPWINPRGVTFELTVGVKPWEHGREGPASSGKATLAKSVHPDLQMTPSGRNLGDRGGKTSPAEMAHERSKSDGWENRTSRGRERDILVCSANLKSSRWRRGDGEQDETSNQHSMREMLKLHRKMCRDVTSRHKRN
jgi:hypothetical protein